jgi:hypothetical protein
MKEKLCYCDCHDIYRPLKKCPLHQIHTPLILFCTFRANNFSFGICERAGRAGFVKQLATGWTVRGSNWSREEFCANLQTGSGAHLASYTIGVWSFPDVKRQEHGVNHPPLSSAEVKEGEKLYLYSSFMLSWKVFGRVYLYILGFVPRI